MVRLLWISPMQTHSVSNISRLLLCRWMLFTASAISLKNTFNRSSLKTRRHLQRDGKTTIIVLGVSTWLQTFVLHISSLCCLAHIQWIFSIQNSYCDLQASPIQASQMIPLVTRKVCSEGTEWDGISSIFQFCVV